MSSVEENENNKRIAKNTLFLSFRLLITMCVGLYTSRVVLNALGINDYGVYNVIGGTVAMFSLFTNSLSAAISRFFSFALGKNDIEKLKRVFSTSVNIQIIMAFTIVIVAELLGYFFLNRLNIPDNRFDSSYMVFHFALLSFAMNLISVPYNAAIVAHERMTVFAYISILEAVLKLVIACLISVSPYDKLITYAILIFLIALIIRLTYGLFCRMEFQECRYQIVFDKSLLKEMSAFAGWNFLGSGAYLFNTQGINIVTNVFFGVATNAARGVANQVESIVVQFVRSFTTAINPQITKSYAAGNLDYMHSLICRGAKFSYLLMLFFVVPFMFETEIVMSLWLKNYPPEAPLFLRLSLVGTMLDMMGQTTVVAAWATGNIKRYYIFVSSVSCLVFPFSIFLFSIGCAAYVSYIVFAFIYLLLIFLKIYLIRDLIEFPLKIFFRNVLLKVMPVTAFSFVLPSIIYYWMEYSFVRLITISFTSVLSVLSMSFCFGLTESEREGILSAVKSKLKWVKK